MNVDARTLYWISAPGLKTTALDQIRAQRLLIEEPSSTCLVVECPKSPLSEHELGTWRSDLPHRSSDLRFVLGLPPSARPATVEIYPDLVGDGLVRLFAVTRTDRLLCVTAVNVSEKGGTLAPHDPLPELELRATSSPMTDFSIKEPRDDWQELVDPLPRALLTRSADSQSKWTASARELVRVADIDGVRRVIVELVDARSQWARLLRIANRVDGCNSDAEIVSILATIDSLNQALASFLSSELLRATQHEAEVERASQRIRSEELAAFERTQRQRDFTLAKYVGAFGVPLFWVTYWASKPAPQWDGWLANLVVVGAALLLAPAAYFIISKLLDSHFPVRNDSKDLAK